jgi:hypothetical protein
VIRTTKINYDVELTVKRYTVENYAKPELKAVRRAWGGATEGTHLAGIR